MFEIDGVLRTWATEPITSFDDPLERAATKLPDHRLHYLDFEGEISENRGSVHRVLAGTITSVEDSSRRFAANITWLDASGQTLSRRVEFYCSLMPIREDETRGDWTFRLDLCR